MDVFKIVLPVVAAVLALTAAGMYLVWICRLKGRVTTTQIESEIQNTIFFCYQKH